MAMTPSAADSLIRQAYSSIGRSGIGNEANQIDKQGYDYWFRELTQGRTSPESFSDIFYNAAANYIAEKPEDKYSQYVSETLNNQANANPLAQSLPISQQAAETFVKDAYASIGRSGVGDAPTEIDKSGLDYWVNQVRTGDLPLADFNDAFASAVEGSISENPSSDVSNYVQNQLDSGATPGSRIPPQLVQMPNLYQPQSASLGMLNPAYAPAYQQQNGMYFAPQTFNNTGLLSDPTLFAQQQILSDRSQYQPPQIQQSYGQATNQFIQPSVSMMIPSLNTYTPQSSVPAPINASQLYGGYGEVIGASGLPTGFAPGVTADSFSGEGDSADSPGGGGGVSGGFGGFGGVW